MATGLCGIVLCGGESRRMGRDKALLRLGGGDGRPMVMAVADRLRTVADPVLLASGRPGRLGASDYAEVADDGGAGPLAGVAAGLRASPHELAAVVAVDMPAISPAVLKLLSGLWTGEDAVVPLVCDLPEPLHAVYARRALPRLRAALDRGSLAMHGVLAELVVCWAGEDDWRAADAEGGFAANLNSPSDLAAWRSGQRRAGRQP
ncbi:MAG: molybdenum cofactor guanylyltransferase [Candidatus Dormibacteria bacterium]